MSEAELPTGATPPARVRPGIVGREFRLSTVPWWAIIIIATGLVLAYLILASPPYHETFTFLTDGLVVTLRITVSSYAIATFIGLFAGLARTSKSVIPYTISTLYVETVRGIPLIVLILYTAFVVVPAIAGVVRAVGVWGLDAGATGWLRTFLQGLQQATSRDVSLEGRAIVALGIGYGAYEAEIFRAGIQSIGRGQMEAARSLGMSYWAAMRHIILPQAIRRVLPPLGNDFISCLKDSSLATVLAVNELTQLGRLRRSSTFRVLETFNVLSFLYLAMTLTLSALVRALERKMKFEE
jgi:polar amino acid transport system permease protein